ncbi:hypothetical protein J6590_040783 [Homalodisca vitripennis]|nr:hypothetical protein J6590_040783 [Homalodisca vitripennis]
MKVREQNGGGGFLYEIKMEVAVFGTTLGKWGGDGDFRYDSECEVKVVVPGTRVSAMLLTDTWKPYYSAGQSAAGRLQ